MTDYKEPMDANIPKEIEERGDDAIREWIAATTCSVSQPLNEVKLLLLGDGCVGKTSLVRRLSENTYRPDSSMTQGIEVSMLCSEIAGQPFNLNIWDFGGQEIRHTTHQLCLSRRSIYVVFLSARGESGRKRLGGFDLIASIPSIDLVGEGKQSIIRQGQANYRTNIV